MRTTWRTAAFTALATLTLGAGPAAAQFSTPESSTGPTAAEFERQARTAVEEGNDWGRAANLFRRAAEAQPDDPAAAANFRRAGLLSYYAGRDGRAVEDLTRAAETALGWGDVAAAAQSFLDAAWVADRDGNGRRTLELAKRAERLAHSPLLARGERAALLSRIADGPQAPALPSF